MDKIKLGPRGFGKTLKCFKESGTPLILLLCFSQMDTTLMKKSYLFKNPDNDRY
jgi:hypothetical protein